MLAFDRGTGPDLEDPEDLVSQGSTEVAGGAAALPESLQPLRDPGPGPGPRHEEDSAGEDHGERVVRAAAVLRRIGRSQGAHAGGGSGCRRTGGCSGIASCTQGYYRLVGLVGPEIGRRSSQGLPGITHRHTARQEGRAGESRPEGLPGGHEARGLGPVDPVAAQGQGSTGPETYAPTACPALGARGPPSTGCNRTVCYQMYRARCAGHVLPELLEIYDSYRLQPLNCLNVTGCCLGR